MPPLQTTLIVAAAVVFAIFLFAQVRSGAISLSRPSRIPGLSEILARAREASGSRARAEALCEAGDLVFRTDPVRRANTAAGYYLRAMRLEPTWEAPIESLGRALSKKPRALERLLWKRLANVSWQGPTRAATAKMADVLSKAGGRGGVAQAHREVLAKLASELRSSLSRSVNSARRRSSATCAGDAARAGPSRARR